MKIGSIFLDFFFTFDGIIPTLFSKAIVFDPLCLQMFFNNSLFRLNNIFERFIDHFLSGLELSLRLGMDMLKSPLFQFHQIALYLNNCFYFLFILRFDEFSCLHFMFFSQFSNLLICQLVFSLGQLLVLVNIQMVVHKLLF